MGPDRRPLGTVVGLRRRARKEIEAVGMVYALGIMKATRQRMWQGRIVGVHR